MPDHLDRLKTALADRYAIERELGTGGMATVYLAEDLKHHRKVAVKVLRPALAAALGAERFLREINIAARLQHPHILTLIDSGEADEFLYYVMPYVEGESLRTKLDREGELPISEAVRILHEVVDALAHAHGQGVVHRDIKPDNILLSGHHAVVADFGVAKAVAVNEATGRQELTTAGVALGTPAYMAPEQAAANPHIDHRADIYAVGALAYELLTGRPPFVGTTPQMVLSAHVTQAPEPVTKHRATVSPAMAQLVMRCLEKKPADRWQTAAELLPQLDALATSSGGTTPTDTRPVAAVGAPRRKTLVAAGALLGAFVVAAAGWWLLAGRSGAADQPGGRIRIAVLPFENLSTSEDDEYFSDGITRDINAQLSKIGGFVVIAHGSARRSSSAEKSYREIADELGVGYLVDGSVRRRDGRVHVNASLIDPESGGQLWTEIYDHEDSVSEIVRVEGDVAREVAAALEVAVGPQERARLAALPTENTEAYNAFLLGRFYWNKRTADGFRRALMHFEEAIRSDSGYARAHAGLADSYALLGYYGVLEPKEGFTRAKQAATRALEIDSTLAEAHTSLAGVMLFYDWDWPAAEAAFKRAIQLNPSYATAHHWYSVYLWVGGRLDESLAEISLAHELDPLSLIISRDVGKQFYFARQYNEAIQELNRTIDLDPDFFLAHWYLGRTLVQQELYDEAITTFETAVALSEDDPIQIAALAHAQALSGNREEALKLLEGLRQASDRRYVSPYAMAEIYIGLGERDSAFAWLQRAYEERSVYLIYLKLEPRFDGLRSDPRFEDLVRQMNFPR